METGLITKIRRNQNLLWELWMLMNLFDGTLFNDLDKLGVELFVVFVFPLIMAPIISDLTLLIAKLIEIRGVRWLVFIGLGGIIPLISLLLVFVGRLVTQKLLLVSPSPA